MDENMYKHCMHAFTDDPVDIVIWLPASRTVNSTRESVMHAY